MEHFLVSQFATLPMMFLIIILGISFITLWKGADLLVNEAVALSERLGVSRVVIGATIVSLGTTLPEVSVSVMAAIDGNPGLAIGNGVGSIICDTGLILGIAALIAPLPVPLATVNRQGNLQILSAIILVVFSTIWSSGSVFENGGLLPQFAGFILVGLLIVYMIYTFYSSKKDYVNSQNIDNNKNHENYFLILLKLFFGVAIVVLSSQILIPSVTEIATRAHIPESVIGATLVAFGTSLPELMTAITSARKGVGDLAIGNIVGADILNVLSVIGISTAVTRGGLVVDKSFFFIAFPAMIGIILLFRACIWLNKGQPLGKKAGSLLLLGYIVFSITSFYFSK